MDDLRRCLVCHRIFCCQEHTQLHERTKHPLEYNEKKTQAMKKPVNIAVGPYPTSMNKRRTQSVQVDDSSMTSNLPEVYLRRFKKNISHSYKSQVSVETIVQQARSQRKRQHGTQTQNEDEGNFPPSGNNPGQGTDHTNSTSTGGTDIIYHNHHQEETQYDINQQCVLSLKMDETFYTAYDYNESDRQITDNTIREYINTSTSVVRAEMTGCVLDYREREIDDLTVNWRSSETGDNEDNGLLGVIKDVVCHTLSYIPAAFNAVRGQKRVHREDIADRSQTTSPDYKRQCCYK